MHAYTTLDLGDRRLAYLEQGSGATLVFLHAFPLHAGMWRAQLAAVPVGWRGLAPDLRGFHQSSHTAATPARHVADHAADVIALLTSLDAAPAVVVGLSMGGYVAFECWRQRPDLVAGLVLADTRAEADTDEGRAKRTTMQGLARAEGPAGVADAMLPGLLGASTQTTDPHVAQQVRQLIEANTTEAIVDALEVLRSRPDARPLLPTITCPTLIVVGAEDSLTPPALSEDMARVLPDATLVTIPRAGHLSNLEHPVAFTDTLTAWLRERFPDGIAR